MCGCKEYIIMALKKGEKERKSNAASSVSAKPAA